MDVIKGLEAPVELILASDTAVITAKAQVDYHPIK